MARLYRRETSKFNALPIFFLPPTIYKLNKPFNGVSYIYAEPMIDITNWQKYSNNYTHCVDQTMGSFSHFSWEYSFHYFMISDLQGSGFLLTDPAIVSQDEETFSEDTNLGQGSINAFFATQHEVCSKEICKQLNLPNPNDNDQEVSV
jgi:hypothetical protein